MKHRHLFGTAALLLCGLSVCLTACGGAGTKVDAETWSEAFDNLDNYTIENDGMNMLKVAGNIFMYDNSNSPYGAKVIADITTDEYYLYPPVGYEWEKMSGETGKEIYEGAAASYTKIFELFKNSYDQFTFTDGKYICETLTFSDQIEGRDFSITMENITVTFDGTVLKEIAFDSLPMEGSPVTTATSGKITEIGSTTVELPTEYADKTIKN